MEGAKGSGLSLLSLYRQALSPSVAAGGLRQISGETAIPKRYLCGET